MTTQQGFLNFTSTSRPVPVKVASLVLASSQSTSIMITENTALETNNLDFRAVVMLSVGLLAAVLTFPAFVATLRSLFRRKPIRKTEVTV